MVTLPEAMELALNEARKFIGATAPNPAVGATILDRNGEVLMVSAHERAGTPHAEAKALALCAERGLLDRVDTVLVTLEPCNHTGRMPPCAQTLARSPVRRVVFGTRDPNPIAGGGGDTLRAAGKEVIEGVLEAECKELLLPFRTRVMTGLPFIVVKTAHSRDDSMVPEPGKKTFTSEASLRLAHELRKRSDAIFTGAGTILADDPEFTVRRVEDHPGKKRYLAIMDRRRRVPESWLTKARDRGFEILFPESIEEGFRVLAEKGCLEVLVEAGPVLTGEVLARGYWHRHYEIRQRAEGLADDVRIVTNDNPPHLR